MSRGEKQFHRKFQEQQRRKAERADLRFQSAQLSSWQSGVQRAVRQTMADQYRNTLMGELLDAMINPPQPQPQPEPEVIIKQPAEETGRLDYRRLHSWW